MAVVALVAGLGQVAQIAPASAAGAASAPGVLATTGTMNAASGPTTTVASGQQSLVIDNAPKTVDGIPTFGANQKIELIGGFAPIYSCDKPEQNDPARVLIANSNIIVTGSGSTHITSVSALGGLSQGTSIGFTGPTGGYSTGTYDVVYDECQDGKYDPSQDAKFTSAFRVVVPVDAPIIDLGATKNAAAEMVSQIDGVLSGIRMSGEVHKQLGRLFGSADRPGGAPAPAVSIRGRGARSEFRPELLQEREGGRISKPLRNRHVVSLAGRAVRPGSPRSPPRSCPQPETVNCSSLSSLCTTPPRAAPCARSVRGIWTSSGQRPESTSAARSRSGRPTPGPR